MIVVTGSGTTINVDQPTVEQVQASYLVTLTGVDGSVWDLNRGPVGLLAGVKLFNTGDVIRNYSTSPTIDGARLIGRPRTDKKELSLPVETKGKDWADWRDVDTAFFRALAPEGEATLTVTAPDATSKSIQVSYVSDGDVEDDFDPLIYHRKAYLLDLDAPAGFWEGDVLETPISTADPLPFLVAPWNGPIYLNPPTVTAGVKISNPGDVDVWWEATIFGPFTGFTVGVGDSVVSSTAAFGAGRSITVYSDPQRRLIVDETGKRINDLMDQIAFKPIPRGVQVPVTLQVTGRGVDTSATMRVTPLYRRPV